MAALLGAGTLPLSVTSVVASGDFAQSNTCASAVQPSVPCTITVTFKPTAMGTRSGSVTVTDNAPGSPHELVLTGTGGPTPLVSLTPASLTFAAQAVGTSSPAQPATLKNTGSGPLGITSIATVGDFAQTNNCRGTVNPGASCTLSVTFTPTAHGTSAGHRNDHRRRAGQPTSTLTHRHGFVGLARRQPNPNELDFCVSARGYLQPSSGSDAEEHRRWNVEDRQYRRVGRLLRGLQLRQYAGAWRLLHAEGDFHSHLGRDKVGHRDHC